MNTRRPSNRSRARAVALWFVLAGAIPFVGGAESAKRSFDITRGDALATLKQFAAQGQARLLYSVDAVKGVKTNPIKGAYTPREALALLVANTGLVITENGTTGALAVSRATSPMPNAGGESSPPSRGEPRRDRAGEQPSPSR